MNNRFQQIIEGAFQSKGDVFDFIKDLEDESIDIVITDPPYGIGTLNLPHANARAYKEGEHYEQSVFRGRRFVWNRSRTYCY